MDGVQVVLSGVGVGELALEELLPGELGAAARIGDERRGNSRARRPADAGRGVAGLGVKLSRRITIVDTSPARGI